MACNRFQSKFSEFALSRSRLDLPAGISGWRCNQEIGITSVADSEIDCRSHIQIIATQEVSRADLALLTSPAATRLAHPRRAGWPRQCC
jgi:hypothetical protein